MHNNEEQKSPLLKMGSKACDRPDLFKQFQLQLGISDYDGDWTDRA